MSIVSNGNTKTTYHVTPEQIVQLIADDLGVAVDRIESSFVVGQDPNSHPLDRFPTYKLLEVKVTV